ncbi:MAG TPA: hypothetical protein VGG28_01080 [Kofleriaceae bacterium]|jgi:hypothetical protein
MEHISVRQRGQLAPMVAVSLLVVVTLASAGATAIAIHHRPSPAELRAAAQRAQVIERRVRIAELVAQGDHCTPALAHELARSLVFDGRSARAYADDYEARCGIDPAIEHWRDAPIVAAARYSMPYFSSL